MTSGIPVHANRLPAIVVHDAGVSGSFDYRSLSAEDAQVVRACGARIRTEMKTTADAVIAIGRELIAVKKSLPHGSFEAWVESECGFSVRSAQNYMRVARHAAKNATVAHLPLATSYRMTGRRTSRWVLNAAAERAIDGKKMSEVEIERLYKMFLDSKARRHRKSRGLVQHADIRRSAQKLRAQIPQQSPRADVPDEISRASFNDSPSRAELAEQSAQWILARCGQEFALSLIAMHDKGRLGEAVRVLKRRLLPA
jgi:hypothetical protein